MALADVFAPLIPWLAFAVAAGLAFWLWHRGRPLKAWYKCRRLHKRMIHFVTIDGRHFLEEENTDSTDTHYSKLFPEREYGPLNKKKETDFLGVKAYTFAANNPRALSWNTILGIEAMMQATGSATPDEALYKYRINKQKVEALDYIYKIFPHVRSSEGKKIEKLKDLKEVVEASVKQKMLTPPSFEKISNAIRICEEVAEEQEVNEGVSIQQLYLKRDQYMKILTDDEQKKAIIENGMSVDVKVIAADYVANYDPRDITSIVHHSMQVGEKKASQEYDIQKLEIREKQFSKYMWGGIAILGILVFAVLIIMIAGPAFMHNITSPVASSPAPTGAPSSGGGGIPNPLSGFLK